MKKESFLKWIDAGNISIPNVLLIHYNQLGLSEEEVMVLLHIHSFIESGNYFPTPMQLASRMSVSTQKCMHLLRTCIQKGMLQIEEHEDSVDHIFSETYSIIPLWEKLLRKVEEGEVDNEQDAQKENEQQIYTLMEKEFGRPLSPIEGETMAMWLDQDHHTPALIVAALKEAVLAGKLNFRYIDRILFEWKKNGIKTVDQAKQYGEKFRQNRSRRGVQTDSTANQTNFPYYNWLEQS